MANVIVYSTTVCPYCVRAKALLKQKNIAFSEINLSNEPDQVRIDLMSKTGLRTVPQIFINGQCIGGCDELYALERSGKLDPLLQAT
jgi:glutaredoxin 3